MPRERLERYGAKEFETHELLAILLRTGSKDLNVPQLAVVVLNTFEDLHSLKMVSLDELMQINGIGRTKAIELRAAMELGVRLSNAAQMKLGKITSLQDGRPVDCAGVEGCLSGTSCRLVFEHENEIIKKKMIFIGGLNSAVAHPREIFRGGSKVFGGARHHWP